jgi:2-polyprenyl-3-methyl-5-hydroxy-6-metoxy-1,4-benzoquinol methylase
MMLTGERLKQGAHPDPCAPGYTPPDLLSAPPFWREAVDSAEIEIYRRSISIEGQPDVRASILDDLSTYYKLDPEECVRRCVHWESWSVQEWQEKDRSSPEALREFYNSTQSWSFDLLWYAYLEAQCAVYPTPVIAARSLPGPRRAPRVLDFGSGVGDTAQLLAALGYTVDPADVSRTLLTFARWRLDRRQQQAGYIDLNDHILPTNEYDVILAKDVLVHVPDFGETVRTLHAALKPGGMLLANLDTRAPSPENAWHLYGDDLPLRRTLQDVGFEQIGNLDGFLFLYRRAEPTGLAHLVRRGRNAIVFGPPRRLYRHMRDTVRTRRARLGSTSGA